MKLSNSGYTCALTCLKMYQFQHVMKRIPAKTPRAFAVGTAVHSGLEGFWIGKTLEESIAMINADEINELEFAQITAMVEGYFHHYSHDGWTLVSAEEEVWTDIREDLTHVMRVDGLARDKDGVLNIIEHKTTSMDIQDHASMYWTRLNMDSQISSYQYALEQKYGEEVRITYDVVRKPTTKPYVGKVRQKKDETDIEFAARKAAAAETINEYHERLVNLYKAEPEKYYARKKIARTSFDRDLWLKEFNFVADVIKGCKDTEIFPRNSKACMQYGKPCPYYNVCCGMDTIDSESFKDAEDRYPAQTNQLPF